MGFSYYSSLFPNQVSMADINNIDIFYTEACRMIQKFENINKKSTNKINPMILKTA